MTRDAAATAQINQSINQVDSINQSIKLIQSINQVDSIKHELDFSPLGTSRKLSGLQLDSKRTHWGSFGEYMGKVRHK